MKELGYEPFLADWSDRENWAIVETIAAYDRISIPYYLVIPGKAGQPAIQLEDAVTPEQFIKALEEAAR